MSNTLITQSRAIEISQHALDAVARHAHFVADLVAQSLDNFCAAVGIDKAALKSCPFCAGFMLELGAVLQLLHWEQAGLSDHIDAGLPSADAACKDLERRAKLGPSEFHDVARLDLWRNVNRFWHEHFSWDGRDLLGAEIAVSRGDEDLFVEQLAQFIWQNRRALTPGFENKETKDE